MALLVACCLWCGGLDRYLKGFFFFGGFLSSFYFSSIVLSAYLCHACLDSPHNHQIQCRIDRHNNAVQTAFKQSTEYFYSVSMIMYRVNYAPNAVCRIRHMSMMPWLFPHHRWNHSFGAWNKRFRRGLLDPSTLLQCTSWLYVILYLVTAE